MLYTAGASFVVQQEAMAAKVFGSLLHNEDPHVRVCVRARVCVCVRARACVCVCVCVYACQRQRVQLEGGTEKMGV